MKNLEITLLDMGINICHIEILRLVYIVKKQFTIIVIENTMNYKSHIEAS